MNHMNLDYVSMTSGVNIVGACTRDLPHAPHGQVSSSPRLGKHVGKDGQLLHWAYTGPRRVRGGHEEKARGYAINADRHGSTDGVLIKCGVTVDNPTPATTSSSAPSRRA